MRRSCSRRLNSNSRTEDDTWTTSQTKGSGCWCAWILRSTSRLGSGCLGTKLFGSLSASCRARDSHHKGEPPMNSYVLRLLSQRTSADKTVELVKGSRVHSMTKEVVEAGGLEIVTHTFVVDRGGG